MTVAAMTAAAIQTPPRGALSALLVGNFVIGMGVLAPAATANAMIADLQVSAAQVGLLVSYGALVLCVGAPLLAYLTRDLDRRLLLISALGLYGVGHLVIALAPSFDAVLAIRLAMIVGAAVFTPQAAAATSLIVPPESRPKAVTYVFLGWSLASSFGMLAMSLGSAAFGWRWTSEALGIASLIAGLAVFLSLPPGLKAPAAPLRAWAGVLRNPAVMTVVAVTALTLTGQFVIFPYLAPKLKADFGADPTAIAVLLSLFGFAGLLGASLATAIVGRLGASKTQALCLGVVALGLALWGLIARDVWSAAAAIVVWGLSFSASNGLQQARLIAIDPATAQVSVALNTSAIYVGQAAGAAIGSGLLTHAAAMWMAPIAVAFVVSSLAASIFAARAFKA